MAFTRFLTHVTAFLLSLLLTLAVMPGASAQIELLPGLMPASSSTVAWWNPSGAKRCGRLLCTRVLLYGDREGLTIAAPITQDGEEQTLFLEERARQIQASFRELVREVVAEVEPGPMPLLWSPNPHPQLHPQTPQLKVGFENEQTVLYLPEQDGFVPRTLATVTSFDIRQNRQISKEQLAQQWETQIETILSRMLWGRQYDAAHPWGRPLAVLAIALGGYGFLITPVICLKRRIKRMERRLRQQQKQMRGAVQLIDPEVASVEELDAAATVAAVPMEEWNGSDELGHAIAIDPSKPTQPQAPGSVTHPPKNKSTAQDAIPFNRYIQPLLENLPTRSLSRQNLLQQRRNIMQLSLRLLFWLQVSGLWLGIAMIARLYPALRPYAAAFLSQTIALPMIWMFVNLADKFCDVMTDRWLDQWAKHRHELDPQSQRYALRADTYSTALRGLTTIGFTLLGVYLTVRLFGLNPAVLASAGFFGAALVLVARGVLQDMLNGVLVLATDRYAVGDVIGVGDVTGLVESMNLYVTQVRAKGGRLVTIPNGQIQTVQNLTKDWSRVEFEVAIAYNSDISKAFHILEMVSQQLAKEPEWQAKILDSPSILGLEQVSHAGLALKVWIKTQPLQQWSVEREFRLRVKLAFDQAGIAIGVPQQRLC